jgi:gamma-glutamyltranspeptidase/glutathione hydrolase
MMAPTIVLAGDDVEVALGSAGSNRIRSAIVQTIANAIDGGMDAQQAVDAPRIHVEGDLIDAEPGVDEQALSWLGEHDWTLRRWTDRNLYFGGVQAVVRDATGELSGGGDPRRGGAVEPVE